MHSESFIIPGSRGRSMAADLLWPSGPSGKRPVVYAHGINGFKDWGGSDLLAEKFAEAGYPFLKFNFSHNGTTLAHPQEFSDLEAYARDNYLTRQYDLAQVLAHLATRCQEQGYEPGAVHLIGHSRGGTDALLFAYEQPDLVHSLTTWAAVSEASTPWRSLSANEMKQWQQDGVYYRPNGRTGQQMPIGYQLYEEYQKHKERLKVERAARGLTRPWHIVHGEADPAVFVKEAYQLKSWQAEAEVSIIEGADHVFNRRHPWEEKELPPASADLVARSLHFLEKCENASEAD